MATFPLTIYAFVFLLVQGTYMVLMRESYSHLREKGDDVLRDGRCWAYGGDAIQPGGKRGDQIPSLGQRQMADRCCPGIHLYQMRSAGAGLKRLSCPGSGAGKSQLADLQPLEGLRLAYLNVEYTKVADLSPLLSACVFDHGGRDRSDRGGD